MVLHSQIVSSSPSPFQWRVSPGVWPVRRTYFGALGAKTVPYCDRLVRLCAIAMVLSYLGYVTVFFGFGCGSGISYPKGLACTYCKGPSVDHYWSDRTVHPLHLALAIPSQHVGRTCSSHQFCRGFGQRGHRDPLIVGICFAGTRNCLFLAIYVPFHLPERIRSSRILTKPRPGRRRGGGPFARSVPGGSTHLNPCERSSLSEGQKRKPLSGVCALAEMKCHKVFSPPSELHPTSTLSDVVHDGGSRASLGLDPTR